MAYTIPWQFLGMTVSGDVGDITIYTDRFQKKVAFPKSPPKEPPSPQQVIARENFRLAQASWMTLDDQEKANLESATKKVSAPLTGQNLFMSAVLLKSNADLETFERQSGVTLPRIP